MRFLNSDCEFRHRFRPFVSSKLASLNRDPIVFHLTIASEQRVETQSELKTIRNTIHSDDGFSCRELQIIPLPQDLKLSLSFLFSNDSSDDSSSQGPLQLQSQRQLSLINSQALRSSPQHKSNTRPFFRSTTHTLTPLTPTTRSHLSISTTTRNSNNGPNQKTEPEWSSEPTPKHEQPACRSSSTSPITTERSRLPSWDEVLLQRERRSLRRRCLNFGFGGISPCSISIRCNGGDSFAVRCIGWDGSHWR